MLHMHFKYLMNCFTTTQQKYAPHHGPLEKLNIIKSSNAVLYYIQQQQN